MLEWTNFSQADRSRPFRGGRCYRFVLCRRWLFTGPVLRLYCLIRTDMEDLCLGLHVQAIQSPPSLPVYAGGGDEQHYLYFTIFVIASQYKKMQIIYGRGNDSALYFMWSQQERDFENIDGAFAEANGLRKQYGPVYVHRIS